MSARRRCGVLRLFSTMTPAMRTFLHAALAALVLIASANAADEIPAGKLPLDAVPRHYALKFQVDPREDRFSGETHIAVRLAKPADRVFLHSQNIDIAKTTVTENGATLDAKAIAHADVGVL